MTKRLSERFVVATSMAAVVLVATATLSAQQVIQAGGQPIMAPTWQAPATNPIAAGQLPAVHAPVPGQEVLADETTAPQTASLLASSTADPNWISDEVAPASYSNNSLSNMLAAPAKGIQVGSISVVPYGILWGDMIYSSSRTYPGHFILWIESDETQGESTMVLDARRSRVGVDIAGPEVDIFGGLKGGGKVEIDFFGGFVIPNTTDVRLRHVYWEAKNADRRFLVGQTWDVVSPLLPSTVNFSVNWAVGNIGFRRTQFRMERYLHLADDVTLTLQGALAQNVVPDLSSGDLAAGVRREEGNWPMIQARTALTFPGAHALPWTLGFSGHVGETGFDFTQVSPGPLRLPPQDDARFDEWSVNADFYMPFTDCLGLHGEMFTGANLSNVLGGIVQGVCPCARVPIRSTGGWAEIWYDWNSCVTSHFGFGIDDPDDDDSLVGRTYNRVIYTNVLLQVTDNLRTGLELGFWRTSYHNTTLNAPDPADRIAFPTEPGEATVVEWTVQYRF